MTEYAVWYTREEPQAPAVFVADTPEAALEVAKGVLVKTGWETDESVETLVLQHREATDDEAVVAQLFGQYFEASDLDDDEGWEGTPDMRDPSEYDRREVVVA